jgi:hypothetical protein
VAPIEPQEADHATSSVVENCNDWLTITVGFAGSIVNAEGVVPDRDTLCGLLLAESVNTRVEVRVPGTDGLKTIVAVQLADAARVVPQVLVEILNSPAFPPVMATEVMLIDDELPLFSVVVWLALVIPTATLAKLRLVGDTVTPVEDVEPVPDNEAVWGLFPAPSETVSVAARAPDAVGLNATVTEQLADAARLAPQVFEEMLKSPKFVPVMDTLLIVIDVVPPFFSVAVCDALMEPTATVA